ncbi:MAG: DNA/RNA nuclease SfsA [Oscillospiraceae bacterium]|nr:DNA/RNA nuclease SfsA [Oscillospiraceae bacterium]MDE6132356.1 DNA/RNA nuclease SfsA [Oscillospiraceae bacterium]
MRYENIVKGRFLERPNRFVAYVEIDGREEICHVKNTGRCRELLVRDCTVYLDKAKNPDRKTKYDLVAVEKGQRLINMDSYAPNIAAGEFLPKIFPDCIIKPEYTYGNSRFDFYIEENSRKILLEVKGVTLEEDGVVMFPDAPTERGLKHVNELIECTKRGFETYVLFVIQMDKVKYFTPNYGTHPEFGEALKKASRAGVKLLAYDCAVTPDGMEIGCPVCIKL